MRGLRSAARRLCSEMQSPAGRLGQVTLHEVASTSGVRVPGSPFRLSLRWSRADRHSGCRERLSGALLLAIAAEALPLAAQPAQPGAWCALCTADLTPRKPC